LKNKENFVENHFEEYTVRKDVFRFYKHKHIQDAEDAYLIGYMACDGAYINYDKCKKMSVNGTELNIIEYFRDKYSPDTKIEQSGIKITKKVNAVKEVFELKFSAKMRELWANYGIFCYKKERRLVGIKHKYFWAYFAGCLDADGFVTVAIRKDQRTPSIRLFITHESEVFLKDLQNKLMEFGVASGLRDHHNDEGCYRLGIQSKFALMPMLAEMLPFVKNTKKAKIISDYLAAYYKP